MLKTGGAGATLACALALGAPAAWAASLPSVVSGQRPGPSVLYKPPPVTSPLSVRAPFRARPLLVSGTDAYRRGEYLYQDYLFDDRGADTVPGAGARPDGGRNLTSPTAGDVFYPTSGRFAENAADLVELRIRPRTKAVVYRVTLNTVRARDAAVVGIGIDVDRSGPPVPWPHGAGIASRGLDRFITAWGTGGEVASLPRGHARRLPRGAVSIDTATNQMTIRVPRSFMDPRDATWRYVAGTGLWNGRGWQQVPARTQPTAETPASGSPVVGAPAVFNLAFRFQEPQTNSGGPPYTTAPGIGNWFEDAQALALRNRTSGGFHADVDFGRLKSERNRWLHRPGLKQARIYASHFQPYEGLRAGFPGYGTRLQPYLVVLPSARAPRRGYPLTIALHAGDSSYTQYAVYDANLYRQLGRQRRSIVVTPFGRGGDTTYTGIGETDVFEAWGSLARSIRLDPRRVAIAGYSIGGYGAYRLGLHYPDLFGRAFTAVGLPAYLGWTPPAPPVPGGQISNVYELLRNARWVPYLDWAQASDQINPYPGPRKLQDRFNALGLRSRLWTFTSGDHFLLSILDEWAGARDFLGRARVKRDPYRVDYAFLPQAETPRLGLRQDHVYWVSGLRARDRRGDPQTDPAVAAVDTRSDAFGRRDPITRHTVTSGAGAGPPMPSSIDATEWTHGRTRKKRNRLGVRLTNLAAATVDGCRARLSSAKPLVVSVTSDGRGALRLALPLGRGSTVERHGAARGARTTQRGAVVRFGAGRSTFVVRSSRPRRC